ncbi:type II secretion system protein [Paucibacter sp. APW11]|uniref:Type II secretion system protein n=1 Tax=Roseateles aquae TaxID=3077235 RepID=A0ABU3P4Y8_9BURK|nr:type II secretion system protein [Paucibacter sp. APW11]MDT8997656.1 type II secretion system protein [Paucibacter sp. APW11]
MLLLVALMGLGMAAVGPLWAQQTQREQEAELLRVGGLYAAAIEAYRDGSPGLAKEYPARLEDLLDDRRFIGLTRHMRRLYPDPMMPSRPWGTVLDAAGRIRAVYSQGAERPLQRQTIELGMARLPVADHYSDWKFGPEELRQ